MTLLTHSMRLSEPFDDLLNLFDDVRDVFNEIDDLFDDVGEPATSEATNHHEVLDEQ